MQRMGSVTRSEVLCNWPLLKEGAENSIFAVLEISRKSTAKVGIEPEKYILLNDASGRWLAFPYVSS